MTKISMLDVKVDCSDCGSNKIYEAHNEPFCMNCGVVITELTAI